MNGTAMAKVTNDRRRRTTTRWLATSMSLLLAVACSGAASQGSSTSSPGVSSLGVTSSSSPGDTSIDASVIGGGSYPGFTVKAPFRWSTDGQFVHVLGPGEQVVLGVSVWDVGRVPRNPCHSIGHLYDPGPTVDDLAAALAAQPMRHATTPVGVTLGGFHGRYLRWSVPAHMVVTGDSNFAGCDARAGGHRDFVSWFGNGMGERWQQEAGQVDRLWILNVDGQRLVVDATYSPATTQSQRAEEDRVVHSLRFVGMAALGPRRSNAQVPG